MSNPQSFAAMLKGTRRRSDEDEGGEITPPAALASQQPPHQVDNEDGGDDSGDEHAPPQVTTARGDGPYASAVAGPHHGIATDGKEGVMNADDGADDEDDTAGYYDFGADEVAPSQRSVKFGAALSHINVNTNYPSASNSAAPHADGEDRHHHHGDADANVNLPSHETEGIFGIGADPKPDSVEEGGLSQQQQHHSGGLTWLLGAAQPTAAHIHHQNNKNNSSNNPATNSSSNEGEGAQQQQHDDYHLQQQTAAAATTPAALIIAFLPSAEIILSMKHVSRPLHALCSAELRRRLVRATFAPPVRPLTAAQQLTLARPASLGGQHRTSSLLPNSDVAEAGPRGSKQSSNSNSNGCASSFFGPSLAALQSHNAAMILSMVRGDVFELTDCVAVRYDREVLETSAWACSVLASSADGEGSSPNNHHAYLSSSAAAAASASRDTPSYFFADPSAVQRGYLAEGVLAGPVCQLLLPPTNPRSSEAEEEEEEGGDTYGNGERRRARRAHSHSHTHRTTGGNNNAAKRRGRSSGSSAAAAAAALVDGTHSAAAQRRREAQYSRLLEQASAEAAATASRRTRRRCSPSNDAALTRNINNSSSGSGGLKAAKIVGLFYVGAAGRLQHYRNQQRGSLPSTSDLFAPLPQMYRCTALIAVDQPLAHVGLATGTAVSPAATAGGLTRAGRFLSASAPRSHTHAELSIGHALVVSRRVGSGGASGSSSAATRVAFRQVAHGCLYTEVHSHAAVSSSSSGGGSTNGTGGVPNVGGFGASAASAGTNDLLPAHVAAHNSVNLALASGGGGLVPPAPQTALLVARHAALSAPPASAFSYISGELCAPLPHISKASDKVTVLGFAPMAVVPLPLPASSNRFGSSVGLSSSASASVGGLFASGGNGLRVHLKDLVNAAAAPLYPSPHHSKGYHAQQSHARAIGIGNTTRHLDPSSSHHSNHPNAAAVAIPRPSLAMLEKAAACLSEGSPDMCPASLWSFPIAVLIDGFAAPSLFLPPTPLNTPVDELRRLIVELTTVTTAAAAEAESAAGVTRLPPLAGGGRPAATGQSSSSAPSSSSSSWLPTGPAFKFCVYGNAALRALQEVGARGVGDRSSAALAAPPSPASYYNAALNATNASYVSNRSAAGFRAATGGARPLPLPFEASGIPVAMSGGFLGASSTPTSATSYTNNGTALNSSTNVDHTDAADALEEGTASWAHVPQRTQPFAVSLIDLLPYAKDGAHAARLLGGGASPSQSAVGGGWPQGVSGIADRVLAIVIAPDVDAPSSAGMGVGASVGIAAVAAADGGFGVSAVDRARSLRNARGGAVGYPNAADAEVDGQDAEGRGAATMVSDEAADGTSFECVDPSSSAAPFASLLSSSSSSPASSSSASVFAAYTAAFEYAADCCRLGDVRALRQLFDWLGNSNASSTAATAASSSMGSSVKGSLRKGLEFGGTAAAAAGKSNNNGRGFLLNINDRGAVGVSLLHIACEYGKRDVISLLLSLGASIFLPNSGGKLPIHIAAEKGHAECLPPLLRGSFAWSAQAALATLSARDNAGRTPLHLSLAMRYTNTALWLVEQGADVASIRDATGHTAADLACRQFPTVADLCRSGDHRGAVLALLAATLDTSEYADDVRRELLQEQQQLSSPTATSSSSSSSSSAMEKAMGQRLSAFYVEVLKHKLTDGRLIADAYGKVALHGRLGHLIANTCGDTCLHAAVAAGHSAVVHALLFHPRLAFFIDLFAENSAGDTILHTAALRGDHSLVQMVLTAAATMGAARYGGGGSAGRSNSSARNNNNVHSVNGVNRGDARQYVRVMRADGDADDDKNAAAAAGRRRSTIVSVATRPRRRSMYDASAAAAAARAAAAEGEEDDEDGRGGADEFTTTPPILRAAQQQQKRMRGERNGSEDREDEGGYFAGDGDDAEAEAASGSSYDSLALTDVFDLLQWRNRKGQTVAHLLLSRRMTHSVRWLLQWVAGGCGVGLSSSNNTADVDGPCGGDDDADLSAALAAESAECFVAFARRLLGQIPDRDGLTALHYAADAYLRPSAVFAAAGGPLASAAFAAGGDHSAAVGISAEEVNAEQDDEDMEAAAERRRTASNEEFVKELVIFALPNTVPFAMPNTAAEDERMVCEGILRAATAEYEEDGVANGDAEEGRRFGGDDETNSRANGVDDAEAGGHRHHASGDGEAMHVLDGPINPTATAPRGAVPRQQHSSSSPRSGGSSPRSGGSPTTSKYAPTQQRIELAPAYSTFSPLQVAFAARFGPNSGLARRWAAAEEAQREAREARWRRRSARAGGAGRYPTSLLGSSTTTRRTYSCDRNANAFTAPPPPMTLLELLVRRGSPSLLSWYLTTMRTCVTVAVITHLRNTEAAAAREEETEARRKRANCAANAAGGSDDDEAFAVGSNFGSSETTPRPASSSDAPDPATTVIIPFVMPGGAEEETRNTSKNSRAAAMAPATIRAVVNSQWPIAIFGLTSLAPTVSPSALLLAESVTAAAPSGPRLSPHTIVGPNRSLLLAALHCGCDAKVRLIAAVAAHTDAFALEGLPTIYSPSEEEEEEATAADVVGGQQEDEESSASLELPTAHRAGLFIANSLLRPQLLLGNGGGLLSSSSADPSSSLPLDTAADASALSSTLFALLQQCRTTDAIDTVLNVFGPAAIVRAVGCDADCGATEEAAVAMGIIEKKKKEQRGNKSLTQPFRLSPSAIAHASFASSSTSKGSSASSAAALALAPMRHHRLLRLLVDLHGQLSASLEASVTRRVPPLARKQHRPGHVYSTPYFKPTVGGAGGVGSVALANPSFTSRLGDMPGVGDGPADSLAARIQTIKGGGDESAITAHTVADTSAYFYGNATSTNEGGSPTAAPLLLLRPFASPLRKRVAAHKEAIEAHLVAQIVLFEYAISRIGAIIVRAAEERTVLGTRALDEAAALAVPASSAASTSRSNGYDGSSSHKKAAAKSKSSRSNSVLVPQHGGGPSVLVPQHGGGPSSAAPLSVPSFVQRTDGAEETGRRVTEAERQWARAALFVNDSTLSALLEATVAALATPAASRPFVPLSALSSDSAAAAGAAGSSSFLVRQPKPYAPAPSPLSPAGGAAAAKEAIYQSSVAAFGDAAADGAGGVVFCGTYEQLWAVLCRLVSAMPAATMRWGRHATVIFEAAALGIGSGGSGPRHPRPLLDVSGGGYSSRGDCCARGGASTRTNKYLHGGVSSNANGRRGSTTKRPSLSEGADAPNNNSTTSPMRSTAGSRLAPTCARATRLSQHIAKARARLIDLMPFVRVDNSESSALLSALVGLRWFSEAALVVQWFGSNEYTHRAALSFAAVAECDAAIRRLYGLEAARRALEEDEEVEMGGDEEDGVSPLGFGGGVSSEVLAFPSRVIDDNIIATLESPSCLAEATVLPPPPPAFLRWADDGDEALATNNTSSESGLSSSTNSSDANASDDHDYQQHEHQEGSYYRTAQGEEEEAVVGTPYAVPLLHTAARYGHDELVAALLVTGQFSVSDVAPLRPSRRLTVPDAVHLHRPALQRGVTLNEAVWMVTPLHAAVMGAHSSTVALLLAVGADPTVLAAGPEAQRPSTNANGGIVAENGTADGYGAADGYVYDDVGFDDGEGGDHLQQQQLPFAAPLPRLSVLHLAAVNNDAETMSVLLAHPSISTAAAAHSLLHLPDGEGPNGPTGSSVSSSSEPSTAASHGDQQQQQQHHSAAAAMPTATPCGVAMRRTPLHYACAAGATACALVLLRAGASLAALDANGDSAVLLAARAGYGGTVEALNGYVNDQIAEAEIAAKVRRLSATATATNTPLAEGSSETASASSSAVLPKKDSLLFARSPITGLTVAHCAAWWARSPSMLSVVGALAEADAANVRAEALRRRDAAAAKSKAEAEAAVRRRQAERRAAEEAANRALAAAAEAKIARRLDDLCAPLMGRIEERFIAASSSSSSSPEAVAAVPFLLNTVTSLSSSHVDPLDALIAVTDSALAMAPHESFVYDGSSALDGLIALTSTTQPSSAPTTANNANDTSRLLLLSPPVDSQLCNLPPIAWDGAVAAAVADALLPTPLPVVAAEARATFASLLAREEAAFKAEEEGGGGGGGEGFAEEETSAVVSSDFDKFVVFQTRQREARRRRLQRQLQQQGVGASAMGQQQRMVKVDEDSAAMANLLGMCLEPHKVTTTSTTTATGLPSTNSPAAVNGSTAALPSSPQSAAFAFAMDLIVGGDGTGRRAVEACGAAGNVTAASAVADASAALVSSRQRGATTDGAEGNSGIIAFAGSAAAECFAEAVVLSGPSAAIRGNTIAASLPPLVPSDESVWSQIDTFRFVDLAFYYGEGGTDGGDDAEDGAAFDGYGGASRPPTSGSFRPSSAAMSHGSGAGRDSPTGSNGGDGVGISSLPYLETRAAPVHYAKANHNHAVMPLIPAGLQVTSAILRESYAASAAKAAAGLLRLTVNGSSNGSNNGPSAGVASSYSAAADSGGSAAAAAATAASSVPTELMVCFSSRVIAAERAAKATQDEAARRAVFFPQSAAAVRIDGTADERDLIMSLTADAVAAAYAPPPPPPPPPLITWPHYYGRGGGGVFKALGLPYQHITELAAAEAAAAEPFMTIDALLDTNINASLAFLLCNGDALIGAAAREEAEAAASAGGGGTYRNTYAIAAPKQGNNVASSAFICGALSSSPTEKKVSDLIPNLLALIPSVNAPLSSAVGTTALMIAAYHGQAATVAALLGPKYDADPTLTAQLREPSFDGGVTALMGAVLTGQTAIAEALLARGADPNARDECGNTPLHLAAQHRRVPIVRLLLRYGARTSLRNHVGHAAEDIAVGLRYKPLMRTLFWWRMTHAAIDIAANTSSSSYDDDSDEEKEETAIAEESAKAAAHHGGGVGGGHLVPAPFPADVPCSTAQSLGAWLQEATVFYKRLDALHAPPIIFRNTIETDSVAVICYDRLCSELGTPPMRTIIHQLAPHWFPDELRRLELSGIFWEGPTLRTALALLKLLPRVETVEFVGCSLTNRHVAAICATLASHPNVRRVDFSLNKHLSKVGAYRIGELLKANPRIIEIAAANTGLDTATVAILTEAAVANKRALALAYNELSYPSAAKAERLAIAVGEAKAMAALAAGGGSGRGAEADTEPPALASITFGGGAQQTYQQQQQQQQSRFVGNVRGDVANASTHSAPSGGGGVGVMTGGRNGGGALNSSAVLISHGTGAAAAAGRGGASAVSLPLIRPLLRPKDNAFTVSPSTLVAEMTGNAPPGEQRRSGTANNSGR